MRQRNDLVTHSKIISDGNVSVNAARAADGARFSLENAMLVQERNSLRAEKESLSRKKIDLGLKVESFSR